MTFIRGSRHLVMKKVPGVVLRCSRRLRERGSRVSFTEACEFSSPARGRLPRSDGSCLPNLPAQPWCQTPSSPSRGTHHHAEQSYLGSLQRGPALSRSRRPCLVPFAHAREKTHCLSSRPSSRFRTLGHSSSRMLK